ncbi:MAG TPA: outer membrane protein transport protein [Longimicrobiales bacterium]|nr:outer membrane protein transport protein [Longimicrobiales bacterium]
MRTIIRAAGLAALLGAPLLLPGGLFAQGLGVYEHSACMSGRNGAGVADPCDDASAVFFNPAGLAFGRTGIGIGITGVRTSNTFVYDKTGTVAKRGPATIPVPNGFASIRLGDRLAAGLGVWAPYGLALKWPLSFEGRYSGYDNSLRTIYIQPTLAYQLVPRRLSVGAGLDVVRGSVAIHQRMDLAEQKVTGTPYTFGALGLVPKSTDFADVALEGDAWGATAHIGAALRITDQLSVGARWMHRVKLNYNDGTATFTQVPTNLTLAANNPLHLPAGTPIDALLAPQFKSGGAMVEQTVTTKMTFPSMAVVGVAFRPVQPLNLLADYQWTGWKTFDELPLTFKTSGRTEAVQLQYGNANTYRVGAEYDVIPALQVRGGLIFTTPAERKQSVSPLLPEAKRTYYSGGLSLNLTRNFTGDVFFQHLVQADRRGRVRPLDPSAALDPQIVGVYTSDANLFGVTLRYMIGQPTPLVTATAAR